MARFFFHIVGDLDVEDPEGQELADVAAARKAALFYARDMAADAVRRGELNLKHRIVVEDEDHDPLLAVTFREAFAITY